MLGAPATDEYVPAWQLVHAVLPPYREDEYLPAEHIVQDRLASTAEKLPGWHASHDEFRPVCAEDVPGVHAVHAWLASNDE